MKSKGECVTHLSFIITYRHVRRAQRVVCLYVCKPSVLSFEGAGMVVDWEQETGLLMTSGDVRVIRIWDTEREMKVQVLAELHRHTHKYTHTFTLKTSVPDEICSGIIYVHHCLAS